MSGLKELWDKITSPGDVVATLLTGVAGYYVDAVYSVFPGPPDYAAVAGCAIGLSVWQGAKKLLEVERRETQHRTIERHDELTARVGNLLEQLEKACSCDYRTRTTAKLKRFTTLLGHKTEDELKEEAKQLATHEMEFCSHQCLGRERFTMGSEAPGWSPHGQAPGSERYTVDSEPPEHTGWQARQHSMPWPMPAAENDPVPPPRRRKG